jgi:hypothetical protein
LSKLWLLGGAEVFDAPLCFLMTMQRAAVKPYAGACVGALVFVCEPDDMSCDKLASAAVFEDFGRVLSPNSWAIARPAWEGDGSQLLFGGHSMPCRGLSGLLGTLGPNHPIEDIAPYIG